MTTAATGIIAKSKERLRASLADCTYFRTWQSNSWNQTQSLARIYYDALPPPASNAAEHTLAELQALRPFVIIFKSGPIILQQIAEPAGYSMTGVLTAMFEQDVPSEINDDPGEVDRVFENFMGDVIATFDDANPGLLELSKISEQGYTKITHLEDDGPYRVEHGREKDLGDHQRYYLDVSWGTRL